MVLKSDGVNEVDVIVFNVDLYLWLNVMVKCVYIVYWFDINVFCG